MAALTIQEVRAIARLARLRPDEERLEKLRHQLTKILDYFSALEAIDLSQVEPTSHVLRTVDHGRTDEPSPCLDREKVLAPAPDPAAGHFRVPRVIG